MILLLIMPLVVISIALIFWSVSYMTYIEMTRENTERQYHSTYEEFKTAFESVNWERMGKYESLQCLYTRSKMHASIFKIKNIGFILSPIGYLGASWLIRNKLKSLKLKADISKTDFNELFKSKQNK